MAPFCVHSKRSLKFHSRHKQGEGKMRRKKVLKSGFTLIELLTCLFIIATLAAILVPNLRRGIYKTAFVACKTNLRNISTALQVYANDSDGYYPTVLDSITPEYMKAIPTCHAGTLPYVYQHAVAPERFTIYCNGDNHPLFCYPNEPLWSSALGLLSTDK